MYGVEKIVFLIMTVTWFIFILEYAMILFKPLSSITEYEYQKKDHLIGMWDKARLSLEHHLQKP